jgi:hypothetical protein
MSIAAVALLCVVFASPVARAQDNLPPAPDPRFGVIEAYHTPELADSAGIGWERIIFYWSEIEREGPDDWNWFHAPLQRIDREIEGGREVVALLAHTPAWATDGTVGAGVPRGLYLPVDDPANLWANFVREVVSAYRGRITHWIIWNEPDIPLDVYGVLWAGTTADYYQLVKVAYLAAREVAPEVQIHLGGLTYWHNPNYLREFLSVASADPTAAENGYYFDVVSVHVYFKPETTIQIIGSVRDVLADYGLDKPIWINETNAPPYDDPVHPWQEPVFRVTQDMQASFLLQEFALALALNVERIAVYKWVDDPPPLPGHEPYGLVREDGTTRPAYDAFRVITRYYAGARQALCEERPEMQTVVLVRGEQTTRVLWARGPYPVVVFLPALAGSASLVDQTGAERVIRPVAGYYWLYLRQAPCQPDEECWIGGPPVVVVEQSSADLAASEQVFSRLAFDLTPRTLAAGGGAIVLVIAAIAGVVFLRKRRVRRPA